MARVETEETAIWNGLLILLKGTSFLVSVCFKLHAYGQFSIKTRIRALQSWISTLQSWSFVTRIWGVSFLGKNNSWRSKLQGISIQFVLQGCWSSETWKLQKILLKTLIEEELTLSSNSQTRGHDFPSPNNSPSWSWMRGWSFSVDPSIQRIFEKRS